MKVRSTECAPSREIGIRPVGGLGNQLFIYGVGYALSKINDCGLHIDPSWFESQTLRHFELNSFALEGHIATSRQVNRLRRKLILNNFNRGQFPKVFSEDSFLFDSNIVKVTQGTFLSGYFQSWRYLQDYAEEIRTQIQNIVNPSPWFLDSRAMLAELGDWTSVHVRRGDYQNNRRALEFHGLAGFDFYDRALRLVKRLDGEHPVVLFSDDLAQSTALMGEISADFLPLKAPPDASPLEVMVLMSLATSAVIANSSFSWWAAWLNDNITKTVIAPRPWFNDTHLIERDLLPSHWITVGK